jgi:uncharacterized protein YgiM (DUF1202 family)
LNTSDDNVKEKVDVEQEKQKGNKGPIFTLAGLIFFAIFLVSILIILAISLVSIKNAPAPIITVAPAIKTTVTPIIKPTKKSTTGIVANANRLNIRSEPNTECSVLGSVLKGESLIIIESYVEAKWHMIEYNGSEAYVSANYIEIQGDDEAADVVTGTVEPDSLTGATEEPTIVSASKLYSEIKAGKGDQYQFENLVVKGKIISISYSGDLVGYYLYGRVGEGVVCWVDGNRLALRKNDTVAFIGYVRSLGINHIELTNCIIYE